MVLKQDFYMYPKSTGQRHHRQAAVPPTHHGRGPISDLFVLQVSQFTQDFSSWVLHFQQLEDGCSIVSDGDVLRVNNRDYSLIFCFLIYEKTLMNVRLTPMSSTNILSRPTGPRELFTMLAIDAAAMTAQITKKMH